MNLLPVDIGSGLLADRLAGHLVNPIAAVDDGELEDGGSVHCIANIYHPRARRYPKTRPIFVSEFRVHESQGLVDRVGIYLESLFATVRPEHGLKDLVVVVRIRLVVDCVGGNRVVQLRVVLLDLPDEAVAHHIHYLLSMPLARIEASVLHRSLEFYLGHSVGHIHRGLAQGIGDIRVGLFYERNAGVLHHVENESVVQRHLQECIHFPFVDEFIFALSSAHNDIVCAYISADYITHLFLLIFQSLFYLMRSQVFPN